MSNPVRAPLSKRLPLHCTANHSKSGSDQNAMFIFVATGMSPLDVKKGKQNTQTSAHTGLATLCKTI